MICRRSDRLQLLLLPSSHQWGIWDLFHVQLLKWKDISKDRNKNNHYGQEKWTEWVFSWELRLKTAKLLNARENAGDQTMISFRCTADCSRGRREFFGPIAGQGLERFKRCAEMFCFICCTKYFSLMFPVLLLRSLLSCSWCDLRKSRFVQGL